ncbi:type II secretion system F family protein [Anaerorhabdus sp.]|uniref:type II secretion system F family protein n=1 Tax=Anaerorhabdus sp. TaxID=1872524 RepID=UPI002FC9250F
MFKKQPKTWMNKQDIEGICVLVQSGFSFQDALRLLKDNKNKTCFDQLLSQLEKGEEIENFIQIYFSKEYCMYLKPFCMFLPFTQSLTLTMKCIKEEKNYRTNILKELLYPSLLFIGTWMGLTVFTFLCFPTLITMFTNFKMDPTTLLSIRFIFICICIFITIVLLSMSVIILLWCNKMCRCILYEMYCKLNKNNMIKTYQSNLFARFYRQCSMSGIKTKETMKLLSNIEIHPILNLMSTTIQKSLTRGEKMEEALENIYLDRTLVQYMKVAIYSSSMDEMLEGYIRINETKMKRKIKRFAKGCQLISYGCIGFIIVIVYQILILPLTLMAQL